MSLNTQTTTATGKHLIWYKALDRRQWNALLASNLGWLFDGYETYTLILTIGLTLHQLLNPQLRGHIPFYAGLVIALTLLGWGIGGMIGGIIADYIGRKRMMMIAILIYSLTTALSAIAWNLPVFIVFRFIVGLALGSEWATGTAMTAELWPDRHRGKGAGLMQCGLGLGFFVASFIWLFMSKTGPDAWRYMYIIGVLPGFATLWIRRRVPESDDWQRIANERKRVRGLKQGGASLTAQEHALQRFTLTDLFTDPMLRRRTVIAILMSLTTTLGWWSISTWIPPFIGSVAAHSGLRAPEWAGLAGMTYNIGAIIGYIGLGFLADRFGRKPITFIFFAMALVMTPILFLWTHDVWALLFVAAITGFFSLGQYTWMPTWLPELYPTHIRSTAIAFCFNAPRFLAWLGPLVAGSLISHFGGYAPAAVTVGLIYIVGIVLTPFLPETVGKPLPKTI